MKKTFLVMVIIFTTLNFSYSQELLDLDSLEDAFTDMGAGLEGAVAASATSGLIWSDAYIGNFPHFGGGGFLGISIIPITGLKSVLTSIDTGASFPEGISSVVDSLGFPIPAVGLDARIGGFGIPFDLGVKYAKLGTELGGVSFDYNLLGAEFRYALIKNILLPKVSVGIGFSRLTTEIRIAEILDGDFQLLDFGGQELNLKNPDLVYGWEANVINLKAQVSKSLIVFTPYLGVDVSYAMTSIGGGVETAVVDGDGNEVPQATIDTTIKAANTLGGFGIPDIDSNGFTTYSDTKSLNYKVFGGLSFNILVIKIDLSGNYDLKSKSIGGQLGLRVQI